MPETPTLCECKCGQPVNSGRRFIFAHNLRLRMETPGEPKPESVIRETHAEAQRLMEHVTECQLQHIGGCKGPLDTAHVDGDEFNNVRENLRKLCRSHHRLLDLKVITLDTERMPAFRVYLSGVKKGVRRYTESRRRERQRRKLRKQGMFQPTLFALRQPVRVGA